PVPVRVEPRTAVPAPALLGPARQALEPDADPVREPGLLHGEGGAGRAFAALRAAHGPAQARAARAQRVAGLLPHLGARAGAARLRDRGRDAGLPRALRRAHHAGREPPA